jgi:hypothetical protein
MPDYQKGKIYKIWSPSKNLVYYGSTTQTLAQRLAKHIGNYKYYTKDNTKTSYMTSFLILECEDYKIELIEECPCNNKEQLHKKEGEYIKNNECVNMVVAGRGKKECAIIDYQKNKEKYIERATKRYEENKEAKKEYDKSEARQEYRKKYRNANADKIKEYQKQYRKELKDNL